MIEYLYDAIRAIAGQDFIVAAKITDEAGAEIVEGCSFVVHFDNDEMVKVDGVYYSALGCWQFTIPADVTKGFSGRYEYSIQHNGNNLCFKEPLYLM